MIDAAFLAGLNHLLEGANWARARLAPFADRHAALVMPPLRLAFAIDADGRCFPAPDDDTPDVTIHLPADTPFRLLQGLDKVMAGARVEGSAEFATELSFVFRHLHWDAEEDLAKLFGDIPAHRMVAGAERFAAWHKQAATHLAENLAEYLAYENPMIVTTREFTTFRDDVAKLNADLSRLEARSKSLT